MKHSMLITALLAALSLTGCDRPTVVTVPVAAPGPAGPQGAPGKPGAPGEPGNKGASGDTTVIVTPPDAVIVTPPDN